jgi:amino acid transporter
MLTGLFFVFVTWGLTVGWGTGKVGTFGTSVVSPAIVLAQRYWSVAWVLVLVAAVNSVFVVAVASSNVSTRMWYAMARSGSLPGQLGRVHPRHGSPSNAVLPVVSTLLLIYIGYKSLVPLPAKPVGWAPVVAGVWALIGVALLVVMRVRGKEQWLLTAGQAMNDPGEDGNGVPQADS